MSCEVFDLFQRLLCRGWLFNFGAIEGEAVLYACIHREIEYGICFKFNRKLDFNAQFKYFLNQIEEEYHKILQGDTDSYQTMEE